MKWLLGAVLFLASVALADTSWAECRILSVSPTYTAGQLKDLTCGIHGAMMVGGGPGSATAAAPTYTEGGEGYLSFDLIGNARVTLGTCISGESACISTSSGSYLMTRSALTVSTQLLGSGGIPTTASDATSAVFQLPHGPITFHGVETCTGTCVQTQKIYGTSLNNTTVATSMLLCTITLNNTTNATESCTVTTNWAYIFVVTSLTSGTTPLSSLIAQY